MLNEREERGGWIWKELIPGLKKEKGEGLQVASRKGG